MFLNTKKETRTTSRPVQAGDYGKALEKTDDNQSKSKSTNTDGRKTLSLWGVKGQAI